MKPTRLSQIPFSNEGLKVNNKANSIRKELMKLEKENIKIPSSAWDSCSSSIKINFVTPTLRSHIHTHVITMASSTHHLPRNFFPSTTKANKPNIVVQIASYDNLRLSRMSVSNKKLARASKTIKEINAQHLNKVKLFTKPKKNECLEEGLKRLREISMKVKENLRYCLKVKENALCSIKEFVGLEKVKRKVTEECNTQSNSPKVGTKRKNTIVFPSRFTDLKPAHGKEADEKKQRRYTTQYHSSKMEDKCTLDIFAAIVKLSLEPINHGAFIIKN